MNDKHMDSNQDLIEVIKFRLEQNVFKGATEGIAKQIVGKGLNSLSPAQESIFESIIKPTTEIECPISGEVFYDLENIQQIEDNGMSGYCQHKWEKMEEE